MIGRSALLGLALVLGAQPAAAQGAPQEEGNIFSNLLKYGGTTVPPSQPESLEPAYCPTVDVPEGGAAMQTMGGRGDGAAGIRTQLSLGRLARECTRLPDGSLRVKVGIEARALLGPSGSPGRFEVPLTIAIKHDEKVVNSRARKVSVTVEPGAAQGFASIVEDDIPVPAAMSADYEIVVSVGAGTKAARPAKPRRKPVATTAPEGGEAGGAQ